MNASKRIAWPPEQSPSPWRLGGGAVRLAGLAALALSARAAVRVLKTRAEQHWQPPSGVTTLGVLNVRRLGASGPPVVLLHGMCGSNRYWGASVDVLAQRCRLVVPDLLGFGQSHRRAPMVHDGPSLQPLGAR